MPLTRDFKETIRDRAARDPKFRKELLREALEAMLSGEIAVAKTVLRDYINATVGFARLAKATRIPNALQIVVNSSNVQRRSPLTTLLEVTIQTEQPTRGLTSRNLFVFFCPRNYHRGAQRQRKALIGQLGDIASILGLLVTVAGFGATLYQVKQSRLAAERSLTASEQSRIAAEQARDRVLELNALNGLDAAVVVLQDIRRLHRMKAWEALPDRYTSLMIDLRQSERVRPLFRANTEGKFKLS